jgi:hypothetical protein
MIEKPSTWLLLLAAAFIAFSSNQCGGQEPLPVEPPGYQQPDANPSPSHIDDEWEVEPVTPVDPGATDPASATPTGSDTRGAGPDGTGGTGPSNPRMPNTPRAMGTFGGASGDGGSAGHAGLAGAPPLK